MATLKEKWQAAWKDPVYSKIIANGLWALVAFLLGLIYIVFSYIKNKISFESSYQDLIIFLNQEKTLKVWHLALIAFLFGITIINQKAILNILIFLLKAWAVSSRHEVKREFVLKTTKEGIDDDGYRSTERCFTYYYLKPSNDTLHWRAAIYFSHDYNALDQKIFKGCPYLLIKKDIDSSELKVELYNEKHKIEKKKSKTILSPYRNEEVCCRLLIDHDKGGPNIIITRLEEEIYNSEVFFGRNLIKLVTWADHLDYEIKVRREQFY